MIGLKFVLVELNGHLFMAMVDSGVTHNFMEDDVSKELGLKLETTASTFKAINSQV